MTKHVSSTFVLDTSLTMAWLLEEEVHGEEVEKAILQGKALVPSLWHLEVANALLMNERRKRIHGGQLVLYKEKLRKLPVTVDEYTSMRAFDTILTFARECGLTAYDASYLELAIRRGLPLATLDKELIKAAKGAGVGIFAV